MRTVNVSFFAVLSCLAMIGATPIRCSYRDEASVVSTTLYVILQQLTEILN